jgi:hypothetical protein
MIRVTREGSPSDAERIGRDAGEEIRSIAGPRFAEYGEAVVAQQEATKVKQ